MKSLRQRIRDTPRAELAGKWSRHTVASFLRGASEPSVALLEHVAARLGVDPQYLLREARAGRLKGRPGRRKE